MDLRKSFDSEVANYDKWRPRYCNELFNDIIEYSKLDSEKKCIEIGCGTGQATEPILKTGSSLLALELGENFTEFTISTIEKYGFVGAECRLFKQVREFTADEYIDLLSTYSDNIALQEPVKTQFSTDIRDVIYSFNNIIKVYDTMELYLSKKP